MPKSLLPSILWRHERPSFVLVRARCICWNLRRAFPFHRVSPSLIRQSSQGAVTLSAQTYGYDSASRLQTVTCGSQTGTYAYYPNSALLNTTTFANGTQTGRSYDSIGRLQTIATTTPVAGTVAS